MALFQQMEYYIYGQIKCLAPVPEFTPAMYPFYFVTAVRKFFFFLDPNKRGRSDALQSHLVCQLLFVFFSGLACPF